MTDAYNAGKAAGIREAAAVVQQMQDRKQVVWPKDILALLDSAPAPAGVTVQEAAKVLLAVTSLPEVYAACAGRSKVYKFQSVLLALSGGRT
jgi:hypothetical protein